MLTSTPRRRTRAAHAAGNFSSPKAQEMVVIRGTTYLELLRADLEKGKVIAVCTLNCYTVLRSLLAFRQVGTNRDYIVVGSDTGRVTVLEYVAESNEFKTVHCETFGKSGCRRIVPGQYLAADPLGRAIMIGASLPPSLNTTNRRAGSRACDTRGPHTLPRALPVLLRCVWCVQVRWRSRSWCT